MKYRQFFGVLLLSLFLVTSSVQSAFSAETAIDAPKPSSKSVEAKGGAEAGADAKAAPKQASPDKAGEAKEPDHPHCRIVDVMPEFWMFWERVSDAEVEYQVPVFRDLVIQPNNEIYTAAVASNQDLSTDRLTAYMHKVPAYLRQMHALSVQLPKDVETFCQAFVSKVPDMNWNWSCYIMPSLFTFNGKTKDLEDQRALFLGVDSLATRSTKDLDVLLGHEMFHIYQDEVAQDSFSEYLGSAEKYGPLYLTLWTEGLATYASKVISVKATNADVLFSPELAQKCPALLPKLAADLLAKIDSTASIDHKNFFSATQALSYAPPRSGYYVGMMVAERLSKKYNLRQMARLGGKTLKQEIKDALLAMADGK